MAKFIRTGPVLILLSVALSGSFVQVPSSPLRYSVSDLRADHRVPLSLPLVEPRIVVAKSKRQLYLYSGGALVKTYQIGLGLDPVNDKIKARDMRTPEGDFYICLKNARSKFYLSLELSYPNVPSAERGLRDGLISKAQHDQIVSAIQRKAAPPQNTPLGGEIFIHGGSSQSDWTWGCIALDNEDIRELFDAIPLGTPVRVQH
jgi:murein L,D-transpeptidase YafK